MNKHLIVGVVGGVLLTALASAQMGMGNGMHRGMGGPGMMGHGPEGVSVLRHRFVMMNGIPTEYAKSHNPLAANDGNLEAGKALFETNCATCHGATGRGDGPAAKGLVPAPADLTAVTRMPIASDAYLDWTISEGGVPVQSAMPPFKATLSKNDIWKLMRYLRTL
jgi:mono/diheme cytochrome c family protein